MVVDPVLALLVVIIGATPAHHESANMPDFRKCHGTPPIVFCHRIAPKTG
jgi:hypothetical protein